MNVSDSGNDGEEEEEEEEASKPLEKRQYVNASSLFFLVWLLAKLLFVGVVRQKKFCICLSLPLPKML